MGRTKVNVKYLAHLVSLSFYIIALNEPNLSM